MYSLTGETLFLERFLMTDKCLEPLLYRLDFIEFFEGIQSAVHEQNKDTGTLAVIATLFVDFLTSAASEAPRG